MPSSLDPFLVVFDPFPLFLAAVAGGACLFFHWRWLGRREAVAIPSLVAKKRLLSEKKQVHFFLTVRLDPRVSDGRQAEIAVSAPCWKGVEEGELVEVLAMPRRPALLFWSPLIWVGDTPEAGGYPLVALLLAGLSAAFVLASFL